MSRFKTKNRRRTSSLPSYLACLGVLSVAPATLFAQVPALGETDEEEEEEVFELSPFEVSGEDVVGYMATSSLAGSRLNTELRDIAAAVQAITPEFMKDIGANDLQKLLVYTTNTEIAGIEGNFYGGDAWDKGHARDMLIEPHRTTRIRGLNSADITRDFFPSDIPIDWYSLSRVDISRGPNSILFGLGSPAGLINNTLKTPVMGESSKTFEVRVDNYGSVRTSVDIDQTIIPGELGVRVSALNNNGKFRQEGTFNDDRRIFAAIRWQPKTGDGIFTQIDANGEWGRIDANRPMANTPADFLSNWYGATNRNLVLNDEYWTDPGDAEGLDGFAAHEAVYGAQSIGGQLWDDHPVSFYSDPTSSAVGGANMPDAMMLRGWMNVNGGGWGSYVGLTNPNWELWNPNHEKNSAAYYAGNSVMTGIINDYESLTGNTFSGFGQGLWPTQMIIDGPIAELVREQNFVGPNKSEFNNFETFNVVATQTYFDNRLGWNVAYNKQDYRSGYTNEMEGLWGGNIISIDINESLRNGEGDNPNVGRLFTIGEGRGGIYQKTRENWRATVFGEVNAEDFLESDSTLATILGKHTFTGVVSSQKYENFDRSFALYRWDEPFSEALNWGSPGYATWRGIHYLSDSMLDTTSMDQITGLSGVTVMQNPEMYQTVLGTTQDDEGAWSWGLNDYGLLSYKTDLDKLYDGASQGYDTTDSKVFVWQGDMLNGAIVPIFGWREDEYERWNKPSPSVIDGMEYGRVPGYNNVVPYSENWVYDADRRAPILAKAQRRSWSVALHGKELMEMFGGELPKGMDITLLYNDSSSFRPSDVASDVYGRQEANPSGETEDLSLLVSAFEDKLSLRVTKYKTLQQNTPFIGDAPAFNRNKAILGRVMDGMMWEIAPQWGGLPSEGGTPAADRYQPTPEWLVNKWMFGEGNYDSTIANEPLPADWRDNPDIMNQPLRIRASAVPGSATYVAQGDINPDLDLAYVAPPLSDEEIAYRSEWFRARTDAEWSRPVDQTFWDAMNFERIEAAWGGFWEISAWEVPDSSRSLNDLESTGIEYEITANPAPNWRISFNASKAEAVRSNVLNSWTEYIESSMDFWFDGGYSLYDTPAMDYWSFQGFYDIPESPGVELGGSGRLGTGYGADILAKYYQARATEQQLVNELREWHFNMVTNYTFADGKFKGLGLGGAYRWMSESNLGYYPKFDADANAWVNDLNNPIKGSSEDYVDAWVSYEKDLGNGKTWSIQLNVYDIFAQDELIPVQANPDGTIAQVRIPGETSWAITNTIRF
nr:TonB-dependent receptor plug domain-containing protein [Pelagicoccus albus]